MPGWHPKELCQGSKADAASLGIFLAHGCGTWRWRWYYPAEASSVFGWGWNASVYTL